MYGINKERLIYMWDAFTGKAYLIIPGRNTIQTLIFLQYRQHLTKVVHDIDGYIQILLQDDHVVSLWVFCEGFTQSSFVVLHKIKNTKIHDING